MSQRFGIPVASVRALGSEFNQTFEVRAADGTRYAAKVYPADAAGTVAWQHRLMDRIALAGDVVAPQVLRDADGHDIATGCDGTLVCGYTWVDGVVIGDLSEQAPALLTDWGRTAGRLIRAMGGVDVDPAVPHTHTWDLSNAPAEIRRHLPEVPDPAHRDLVDGVLGLFDAHVAPRLADLPRAVAHQDLNDFNVLVSADGAHITGVIDFGDAIHTTRISELAIAAAYAMQRKPAPLDALCAVAAGYDEVVALTDAEIAVLYPLAATRLATNATVWAARRHGDTADYARARSQHTWTTLGRLSALDPGEVRRTLRRALGRPEQP